MLVFVNPPLGALREGVDVQALVAQLRLAHDLGARGVKFFKSLGLGARWPDGSLVEVDDPRLDPLFDAAGALGMPVAIHTGDPKAFWLPATEANERFDELSVHPGWSYAGRPVPSWSALYEAFLRRVGRHPRTTFIGVHFGNDPEDPVAVSAALDQHPNLYVDTAARVPERYEPHALLGHHYADHERWRDAAAALATLQAALFAQGEASAPVLSRSLEVLRGSDLRATLGATAQPALVVGGQYDRVTPPGAARALAAALPHARHHEFARCGHAPFLTHEAEFAALLRDFVAALDAAATAAGRAAGRAG